MTYTNPSPGVAADGDGGLAADVEHVHGMPQAWPSAASPKVVALTDAATIAVDASLGNVFRVTLGGSRTIAAPTNPVDGQSIRFELKQDATGSRIITWTSTAGGFSFGGGSAPTLTTTGAKTDSVRFTYNSVAGKWLYDGSNLAF